MVFYERFMKSRVVKRRHIFYWWALGALSVFATWLFTEPNVTAARTMQVWFNFALLFLGVTLLRFLSEMPIRRRLEEEMSFRENIRLQSSVDAKLKELYWYLESAFARETRFLEEQVRVRGQATPASKDKPSTPFSFGGNTLESVQRDVAQRKSEFWAFHGTAKRLGYDVEDTVGAYKTPLAEVAEKTA